MSSYYLCPYRHKYGNSYATQAHSSLWHQNVTAHYRRSLFQLSGTFLSQLYPLPPTYLQIYLFPAFFWIGPIWCPETSVPNYKPAPFNIREELRSDLRHAGSMKSRKYLFSFPSQNIFLWDSDSVGYSRRHKNIKRFPRQYTLYSLSLLYQTCPVHRRLLDLTVLIASRDLNELRVFSLCNKPISFFCEQILFRELHTEVDLPVSNIRIEKWQITHSS